MSTFDRWLNSNNPMDDAPCAEVSDEHEAQAIAELGNDPGALWPVLESSSFYKDHALFLFEHSPEFRAEVIREESKWIEERAQEIADAQEKSDAEHAAEEAAINRAYGRKHRYD